MVLVMGIKWIDACCTKFIEIQHFLNSCILLNTLIINKNSQINWCVKSVIMNLEIAEDYQKLSDPNYEFCKKSCSYSEGDLDEHCIVDCGVFAGFVDLIVS